MEPTVTAPRAYLGSRADDTRLVGEGAWLVDNAATLDGQLREAVGELGSQRTPVTLAVGGVSRLDTAGAWLLHRTRRELEAQGVDVRIEGLEREREILLGKVAQVCFRDDLPPPPKDDFIRQELAVVGRATLDVLSEIVALLAFFGALVATLTRTIVRPWRLRVTSFSSHVISTGLEAMPIVGLMAFLIGIVLAFQGASQLQQFGAEIFTIDLLAISILREIGVLLTAIIVAGRSGSAFTAQIGTMVVNEEVDAMRTLGLDPMEVLVLPRVLALIVALPLLTVFANAAGLLGGGMLTILVLDIPLSQFFQQLRGTTDGTQLLVGLVKAPVFAFVIAMVGCRNGLLVEGDAASVGRLTTQAVVSAIFLVIVLNAVFSIIFNAAGI